MSDHRRLENPCLDFFLSFIKQDPESSSLLYMMGDRG